jgi:multicomponent Na+:H+ antiporter subunit E
VRAGLMALVWLGLNGTDWRSWIVGGPAVLAAAWTSVKLLPAVPWRLSIRGALAFGFFFICESARGGWDVARRALSPGLRLEPVMVRYEPRLPAGVARLFFCAVVTMLPGTAAVAVEERFVVVHILDYSPGVEAELRQLERRVAGLFGHALPGEEEARA